MWVRGVLWHFLSAVVERQLYQQKALRANLWKTVKRYVPRDTGRFRYIFLNGSSTDTVRALGDGRGQASRMAGEHIAEALWRIGRTSDLHEFVSAPLARKPSVFRLLLEAGTESLRSRAPGVARNVFALLLRAGESLKAEDSLAGVMPTVRRRMAHCLRLLGEYQGAVDLLQKLFREESDPGVHAMVHADLGLLQGRFALLDEVRISGDKAERSDLVDRLKAGETHYRDAVANPDAAYASHGHYCLGRVVARGRWLGRRQILLGGYAPGKGSRRNSQPSGLPGVAARADRSLSGNCQVAVTRRGGDPPRCPTSCLRPEGCRHPASFRGPYGRESGLL